MEYNTFGLITPFGYYNILYIFIYRLLLPLLPAPPPPLRLPPRLLLLLFPPPLRKVPLGFLSLPPIRARLLLLLLLLLLGGGCGDVPLFRLLLLFLLSLDEVGRDGG